MSRQRVDALFAFASALNYTLLKRIVDFTTTNRLPSMFGGRDFVEAGGLMHYWTNWDALRARTAVFLDKILNRPPGTWR